MYAYTANNPVNRVDPSGYFWDYILDAASIYFSYKQFMTNPCTDTFLALAAADVILGVVPIVTAEVGYAKYLNKIDATRLSYDFVYRVIRADEDPLIGLIAKNPDRGMSIEGHIISGSRNNGSQFISTTRNLDVAQSYAKRDGCRIVKINLNKLPSNVSVYDLSTDIGRNTYLKGITARNFARSSQEVLIEGFIPSSAITLLY